LVDRDFFALLDQLLLVARSQGQANEMQLLMALREKLLNITPAGQEVRRQQDKVRALLAQITPATTREQLLEIVVNAWHEQDGQQMVGTLAVTVPGVLDYQFLMLLTGRIDETVDAGERTKLEELRQFLLQVQHQVVARQRETQEAMAQEAQAVLQEVLQATDLAAALRERAEEIDESFLALLAANIQQAERSKATAAARRLRQIYEQAVTILQENLPPDLRLLNQLLSAGDEATVRQLLKDNRALLSKEFVDSLKPLEGEMRDAGRAEVADRIKTLRGQITLMM
jgi:hypothetical protein